MTSFDSSFSKLPLELLLQIFTYLPVTDTWRLRSVCKDWSLKLRSDPFSSAAVRRWEAHSPSDQALESNAPTKLDSDAQQSEELPQSDDIVGPHSSRLPDKDVHPWDELPLSDVLTDVYETQSQADLPAYRDKPASVHGKVKRMVSMLSGQPVAYFKVPATHTLITHPGFLQLKGHWLAWRSNWLNDKPLGIVLLNLLTGKYHQLVTSKADLFTFKLTDRWLVVKGAHSMAIEGRPLFSAYSIDDLMAPPVIVPVSRTMLCGECTADGDLVALIENEGQGARLMHIYDLKRDVTSTFTFQDLSSKSSATQHVINAAEKTITIYFSRWPNDERGECWGWTNDGLQCTILIHTYSFDGKLLKEYTNPLSLSPDDHRDQDYGPWYRGVHATGVPDTSTVTTHFWSPGKLLDVTTQVDYTLTAPDSLHPCLPVPALHWKDMQFYVDLEGNLCINRTSATNTSQSIFISRCQMDFFKRKHKINNRSDARMHGEVNESFLVVYTLHSLWIFTFDQELVDCAGQDLWKSTTGLFTRDERGPVLSPEREAQFRARR